MRPGKAVDVLGSNLRRAYSSEQRDTNTCFEHGALEQSPLRRFTSIRQGQVSKQECHWPLKKQWKAIKQVSRVHKGTR